MTENYAENGTIAGYFEDHSDAQQAVEQLRNAGFTSAHLGVAHRGGAATGTSSSAGSGSTTSGGNEPGMWDKVKNFFEGGAEPYADERTQGDMATREVTPNPADDYSYGHDSLHQSLSGMSVPKERSQYFGDRFNSSENGAVVTVNAGARAPEAEQILRANGADLGDKATDYKGEYAGKGTTEGMQNIQLLGEVLRVHKDRVSRGEVSIRKDVITETQTIEVPVTREELVIERRAVTGETQASGTVGEGQEIRIPLTEERASVDKGTVVREEVAVGKKAVGGVSNLADEVRHEELVIDDQTRRAVNE